MKRSNDGSNKLTVIGDVDPVKLREMLEKKTKKKVDLVSPQPKKDKDKDAADKKNGENKPEKFKEVVIIKRKIKKTLLPANVRVCGVLLAFLFPLQSGYSGSVSFSAAPTVHVVAIFGKPTEMSFKTRLRLLCAYLGWLVNESSSSSYFKFPQ